MSDIKSDREAENILATETREAFKEGEDII